MKNIYVKFEYYMELFLNYYYIIVRIKYKYYFIKYWILILSKIIMFIKSLKVFFNKNDIIIFVIIIC